MKYKQIIFDKEARQKLASGADKLARAVVATLGPRSYNASFFDSNYYIPRVVHDGVTVARQIFLKDKFEDLGAQLLKQAASQTNDLAGDGTTTATLLANTLIQEGLKLVEGGVGDDHVIREQVQPQELREQLEYFSGLIVKELDNVAIQIKTKKQIAQIAKVSAQYEGIGNMVAEAVNKVGGDGIILVEKGTEFTDSVEYQEGTEYDNGYLSPYFITDPRHFIVDYTDGYILITDYTITHPDQIVPIIEKIRKADNKPLLIIANDIIGPALETLIRSKIKADYKLTAMIAPEYGERRFDNLEDLAILTGGEVVTPQGGTKIEHVEIRQLGRFRKLEMDHHRTTISPKDPDKEEIEARADSIRNQLKKVENDFTKQLFEKRLARLTQGVAIITVGGGSDVEIAEKYERFIDSIHATKAAIAEGIVPGGGCTLRYIGKVLFGSKKDRLTQVEKLVQKMLEAPFLTILKNSGITIAYKEVTHIDAGYDVRTKKEVDMTVEGIIDPVKVTKLAVQNAMSVAGMILTNYVLIVDEDEKDENA